MSRQCWRRPGVALLAVLLSMVKPAVGHAAGADAADAAQKKDIGALRALVQRRVDVNAAQPDGTTALHWAVVWNSEEATSLLLRAGADAKARNRYGATPLSEAVTAGSAAMVDALLKAGADPKTLTTEDGETVLMTAARAGNADVVRMLLDRGADVNARENVQGTDRPHVGSGRTPSHRGEAPARSRRRLESPIDRPGNQGAQAERGFVDLADRARRVHGSLVFRPRGRHRVCPRDARGWRGHQLRRCRQHQRARRGDHEQAIPLREVPDRSRSRRERRRCIRPNGAVRLRRYPQRGLVHAPRAKDRGSSSELWTSSRRCSPTART